MGNMMLRVEGEILSTGTSHRSKAHVDSGHHKAVCLCLTRYTRHHASCPGHARGGPSVIVNRQKHAWHVNFKKMRIQTYPFVTVLNDRNKRSESDHAVN